MRNITIDQRSNDSVYITFGDWVVYLDDSTGEKLIDSWEHDGEGNLKEEGE